MTIEQNIRDRQCTYRISGRLDTSTAPMLEVSIKEQIQSIDLLIFDFTDLAYLSSAGLRVLLASYKKMRAANGDMRIQHANDTVKEILMITGMDNIFTIE